MGRIICRYPLPLNCKWGVVFVRALGGWGEAQASFVKIPQILLEIYSDLI